MGEGSRLTASLFLNKIEDLISMQSTSDGSSEIYRNVGMMETAGAELEFEKRWAGGIKGLIGYTYQETKNGQEGGEAANSPKHLIKANLMLPLFQERLFAGIEEQYTSERMLLNGSYAGSFFITNITLSAPNLVKRMDAFVSVYNLFDRRYDDPASHQHKQSTIEQDGISFRLKLVYKF
jgi:iron complex outermembrane receptor protein